MLASKNKKPVVGGIDGLFQNYTWIRPSQNLSIMFFQTEIFKI